MSIRAKHSRGSSRRRGQQGVTLIEILVTLVILMVGLLGLVGVMIQSQRSQFESYQRVQALMLVQDLAARMNANKAVASCYVLSGFLGGTNGITVPAASTCTTGTSTQKARVEADLTEWRDLLLGASEQLVSGSTNVGGMLGARGCVTQDATSGIYQVSIAWQGTAGLSGPPAGITCGQGEYGGETFRRAVAVTVQMGT
jgi:type IV pilus assembly protein PilV